MKWPLLILTTLCLSMLHAADQGAAKAIIVKGTVQATIKGNVVAVKKGMWLPEGTVIQTAKRSFTKLLFIDKSSMNVGPESKMKIDSFPKKDAGIITLIKGQIRSKVTKNYMEIKKKDKSKLFIKTETAAMGVRGTDFIVSFNPVKKATSLITFEGAVAMGALTNNLKANQQSLEQVVSSPSAVMVTRGQFSGTDGSSGQVSKPVKMTPSKIKALEKAEVPTQVSVENSTTAKTFRDITPPGVSADMISNDDGGVTELVGTSLGQGKMNKLDDEVAKEQIAEQNNNSESGKDRAPASVPGFETTFGPAGDETADADGALKPADDANRGPDSDDSPSQESPKIPIQLTPPPPPLPPGPPPSIGGKTRARFNISAP